MTDFYLDTSAYELAASFTASRSTTTLTVSAITSGKITLGARVFAGSTDLGIISAYGTGTGGTGTYTMNASGTVASTAMTTVGGQLGNTPATCVPTWGVAQDGDGSATGAATSAIATFDFAGITGCANGDTIIVGGATLTAAASGNNTFSPSATPQTLVDNIVNAINATGGRTITVTVAQAAAGWPTPKLQDAVYARRTGTAVLEVMTRAGSAAYNANAAFKLAGTTGLSTVNANFSGGAGGCWGWPHNFYTMWPSAIGVASYGAIRGGATLAGTTPAVTDTVHVRGNDIAWEWPLAAQTIDVYHAALIVADDGTKWAGDSGTFTVHLTASGTSNQLTGRLSGYASRFSARQRGGLVFKSSGTCGLLFGGGTSGAGIAVENALFDDNGGAIYGRAANCANAGTHFSSCDLVVNRNAYYPLLADNGTGYPNTRSVISGCTLSFPQFTGTPTFVADWNDASVADQEVIVENTTVSCPVASGVPYVFGGTAPGGLADGCTFIGKNVTGAKINNSAGVVGTRATYMASRMEAGAYILQQNIGPNRNFRLETTSSSVEWDPTGDYPTLDSYLPGGTAWSYKCLWSNTGMAIPPYAPQSILQLAKTVILASQNKVRLEVLVDPTYASEMSNASIGIAVAYTDASDVMRVENSFIPEWKSGTTLPSSAASWTLNGATGYVARKIELTLAANIKQNTEIDVDVKLVKPLSAASFIYINPEVAVTA